MSVAGGETELVSIAGGSEGSCYGLVDINWTAGCLFTGFVGYNQTEETVRLEEPFVDLVKEIVGPLSGKSRLHEVKC